MKFTDYVNPIYKKSFSFGFPSNNTNGIIIKYFILSILYLLIFFMIYGPITLSIKDDKDKHDMKWITLSLFITSTIMFFVNEIFFRLNDL